MTAALRHPAPRRIPARSSAARRRRAISLLAVGIFALCVTLLVAAYFQTRLVAGQHRIDELRSEHVEAERMLQKDRLELAVARSPETIQSRARALGMVTVEERTVVGGIAGTDDGDNGNSGNTGDSGDTGDTEIDEAPTDPTGSVGELADGSADPSGNEMMR